MSKLRPTLINGYSDQPCPTGGTAYFMILAAVRQEPGLVHGKLHDGARSCALGSYFNINQNTCLPWDIIDEVALVNDSMPTLTPLQRKRRMLQWLRWKLSTLGMTGLGKPKNCGAWPNGKAPVLGTGQSRFESSRPDDWQRPRTGQWRCRRGHRRSATDSRRHTALRRAAWLTMDGSRLSKALGMVDKVTGDALRLLTRRSGLLITPGFITRPNRRPARSPQWSRCVYTERNHRRTHVTAGRASA